MTLQEMKFAQKEALTAAEANIKAAEQRGTGMTKSEEENYNTKMTEFQSLSRTVAAREKQSTIRAFFRNGVPSPILLGNPSDANDAPLGFVGPVSVAPVSSETRSPEYKASLLSYLKTGGKCHDESLNVGADGAGGYCLPGSERYTFQRLANGSFPKMRADMYEGSQGGSDSAGGYAITVPTETLIIPLALPDLGIFDASTVIPTASDIKIPQQASFGTSALKAESTGTIAQFGGTDPTLGQITLTAFMAGAVRWVSWELMQDVQAFQQFVVEDLLKGQRILEDSLLASGSGNNQPLGIFGNTGNGTGAPYNFAGTAADSTMLLNSLFDVTSTLKGTYQANASWVMSLASVLSGL